MLAINDLAMNYGHKLLFTNVNLQLNSGNRYALVGANGSGKSTFLKLLTQETEACFGDINIAKSSRIGWLKQDQFRFENTSILNTTIAGRKQLWQAICEKEELLNTDIDEASGYRLGELEHIIMDNDGYSAEAVAGEILIGLGIKEEYHHQPLSVLSGGYKLRVLLAQSLFDNPDILLLDEPTNHLDINSIYWLEDYLKKNFNGLLIFISHDLSFINNVATHVLDIDYGEITQYTGNYNKFETQKQLIIEQKLHQLNYLENKISKMKVFVDKFRAGTRSKQAQSREKMMDKIELPDIQKSSRVSPYFNFKQKRPSGKHVLKLTGISKNFAEHQVLNNVGISVNRGEKIVIIGPNGVGKSTLLKIIMKQLNADSGQIEWGYEPIISYFAQDHHETLKENINTYDWLQGKFENLPISTVRGILGQLLFKQDDAFKNVLLLSGGEAARLLFAKIILEESNMLILDEPTNHLDIEAKQALKKALIDYPGTLLLVTHDRDFASAISTRILAITPKKVTDFRGSYDEYLAKFGQDYFRQ